MTVAACGGFLGVMTGYGNVSASVRSFRGGAVDFLEKPVVPRVLLSRIREALAADQRRQERSAVKLRLARLTSREKEVAGFLVKGKRSKEIAAALGISPRTAEGHRRQVLRKMEVGSTAELATAWFTQQPTTPATGTTGRPTSTPRARAISPRATPSAETSNRSWPGPGTTRSPAATGATRSPPAPATTLSTMGPAGTTPSRTRHRSGT